VTLKIVICAFIISPLFKDVIANGHGKLNRLTIARPPVISCWKLLKLVDECERYGKPNQCYFWHTLWLKKPNFWGSCSPGSAETLTREDGITNQHLNSVLTLQHLCQKLPKSVYVRWSYSVLHQWCFFETQCMSTCPAVPFMAHCNETHCIWCWITFTLC